MWYFTWILGAMLASTLAIVNAMWLEVNEIVVAEDADPQQSQSEQPQPEQKK